MREIDVVDEAIIDASPSVVYQAIVDEMMGKTHWWSPYLEARLRGKTPADQASAIFDIKVHSAGAPKFTAKTIDAEKDRLLRVQYVEGDFSGVGIWTLEPVGDRTRLSFRWQVKPQKWLTRMLSPFIDIGKIHSEVMKRGFEGLNRYVTKRKEELVVQ